MRLQRMIALSSELSRRAAEEAILNGDVKVNGDVVKELGTVVDIFNDKVFLKEKQLIVKAERKYFAFHKPKFQMVTKSDPEGRETIWTTLRHFKDTLNSVGRLDFESEGLLLLTDDGDFINLLTHPRHEIWKTYRVWVKGTPTDADLERLRKGVSLEDGKTLPARVALKKRERDNTLLEISIREGKNRQVRRMLEHIGCQVRELKRIAIGPVRLGRLAVGKWRDLSSDEIKSLMAMSKGS